MTQSFVYESLYCRFHNKNHLRVVWQLMALVFLKWVYDLLLQGILQFLKYLLSLQWDPKWVYFMLPKRRFWQIFIFGLLIHRHQLALIILDSWFGLGLYFLIKATLQIYFCQSKIRNYHTFRIIWFFWHFLKLFLTIVLHQFSFDQLQLYSSHQLSFSFASLNIRWHSFYKKHGLKYSRLAIQINDCKLYTFQTFLGNLGLFFTTLFHTRLWAFAFRHK